MEPIRLRCDARDTSPVCCDGRCLEGYYCPQQDACPARAAAHDVECGVVSPMVRSKLGAHLRQARADQEARDAEAADLLDGRGANRWLRGWAIAAAVAAGACIAAWLLI